MPLCYAGDTPWPGGRPARQPRAWPHRLARPLLLALAGGAGACAPARFVKPLAAGQQAVNVSLGGPLIGFGGAVIPLPFLTATYGRGFTSTLTGFGGLNVTSALYGNVQAELGLTKQLLAQRGWVPGLSVSPAATVLYRSGAAFKLYPTLDGYACWDYRHHRSYVYAGLSNWLELSDTRAFGRTQDRRWVPVPLVGTVWGGARWSFTLEGKVIAPNVANNYNTADYRSPFGTHGALGVYLGVTRKF